MELRAVLTFLWRTVYLQAVRRYYWYTALELIYVVVVFTAFQVPEVPADIRPLANETATISADDLLAFFSPTAVVFTPNTSYYDYLMRAVIAEIDALPTANLGTPRFG
ncbi:hypothetical protein HPB48_013462 [Haemaphysalis longicornis]|uniref:Uncharacterized protein n=1 Tax=Haemaphysalis longicornis TaxID=44386 RepID=A0A9J6G0N3_HAELO|nr:hypothetical protein HPB48_013462 [Haemaphysalis longicornis]